MTPEIFARDFFSDNTRGGWITVLPADFECFFSPDSFELRIFFFFLGGWSSAVCSLLCNTKKSNLLRPTRKRKGGQLFSHYEVSTRESIFSSYLKQEADAYVRHILFVLHSWYCGDRNPMDGSFVSMPKQNDWKYARTTAFDVILERSFLFFLFKILHSGRGNI